MFKNCHSAYKIIQTTYDREAEDTGRMRVILDALDKTRYLCGELLENFKIFERNYHVSVIISLMIIKPFRKVEKRTWRR